MARKVNNSQKSESGVHVLLLTTALTIASTIVSIVLSLFFQFELHETILVAIAFTLFFLIVELLYKIQIHMQSISKLGQSTSEILNDLKLCDDLYNSVKLQANPFIKGIIHQKLKAFLSDNQDLFNGTYRTNPHSTDTFGVRGIELTRSNGRIQAVSSVPDYWSDDFTHRYLEAQKELIKKKHIQIQRIFIFSGKSKEDKERYTNLMEQQMKIGIDVYYIDTENQYVNDTWKTEDFLIQDDTLLVELDHCNTHTYFSEEEDYEIITTDVSKIETKKALFEKMCERATKYTKTAVKPAQ
jgi:hypothetical protein